MINILFSLIHFTPDCQSGCHVGYDGIKYYAAELVAVKIIDKSKLNKEGLLQQSQEVRILSRLSQHEHPNIVKLYQVKYVYNLFPFWY